MPKLTAAKAKALATPGMHGDGEGLYLSVSRGGSRSWVQRISVDGRRREIGLGPFPAIGLAQARILAAANRIAVAEGRDPLAEKHEAKRKAAIPTFRQAAEHTFEANKPRWRNGKHTVSWWQTLERHALPILGDMPVDRIGREDVLQVLTPIWGVRMETARRVRQRMRTVLRWCMAHGYVDDNVAGEAIDGALPPMPRLKAHLRSLPYQEVAEALATVDACGATMASKLCLRFLVLTAARSGEARGATWNEIHEDVREWRIPASRMKAGVEHRVPLSDAALKVLAQAWLLRDQWGLIFPSSVKPGHAMSDMTLTQVLRKTGLAQRSTVHGFRSAFRDWAAECTSAPHAVMELSLAHSVGSSVEQAYARSDLLEKRRTLMEQWADFVAGGAAEAWADRPGVRALRRACRDGG